MNVVLRDCLGVPLLSSWFGVLLRLKAHIGRLVQKMVRDIAMDAAK